MEDHWLEDLGHLKAVIMVHFHDILSSFRPAHANEAVAHVYRLVDPNDNAWVARDVSNEEVRVALFQMNPTKASGPEVMCALFFQNFWDVVGGDVVGFVMEYFRDGVIPAGLDMTNILLISIVKSLRKVSEFLTY